jgi:hypothetical protein
MIDISVLFVASDGTILSDSTTINVYNNNTNSNISIIGNFIPKNNNMYTLGDSLNAFRSLATKSINFVTDDTNFTPCNEFSVFCTKQVGSVLGEIYRPVIIKLNSNKGIYIHLGAELHRSRIASNGDGIFEYNPPDGIEFDLYSEARFLITAGVMGDSQRGVYKPQMSINKDNTANIFVKPPSSNTPSALWDSLRFNIIGMVSFTS